MKMVGDSKLKYEHVMECEYIIPSQIGVSYTSLHSIITVVIPVRYISILSVSHHAVHVHTHKCVYMKSCILLYQPSKRKGVKTNKISILLHLCTVDIVSYMLMYLLCNVTYHCYVMAAQISNFDINTMKMAYLKYLSYINYDNLQIKSFTTLNKVAHYLKKNKTEIIIVFGYCEFCAILSLFACLVT